MQNPFIFADRGSNRKSPAIAWRYRACIVPPERGIHRIRLLCAKLQAMDIANAAITSTQAH
jgi:hypothetical protein